MSWQDDYVYGSSDYPATGSGEDIVPEAYTAPEAWDALECDGEAE